MELIEFITSKINFTEQECQEINDAFHTETYNKGALLIKSGSYSDRIFFIEQGLVRIFYYKEDKDITQFFSDQGTFTASLSSFTDGKPEPYGWEALEPTKVRVIAYKDLQGLFTRFPMLQQVFLYVCFDMINMFSLKLESIQFQTAEQRYTAMMETYPGILLRVPLGHIASYLGITQQTLSVIRGRR